MSRTTRALKGTLTSFGQYATQIALQALLAPIVLKYAGQQTLGAYAVVAQAIGYLSLVDFGFSATLSRFLAHASGANDEGKRFRDVLSTGRTVLIGTNTVFAFLCGMLAFGVEYLLKADPAIVREARIGLLLLGTWALVRNVMLAQTAALIAIQDLAFRNIAGAIGGAIRLVGSLGLVYAGMGVVGLMLGNIVGEAIEILICFLRFRKLRPGMGLVLGIRNKELFHEMLRFSMQSMLISIATRLILFTDNIVVGNILNVAWASVYFTTQMPAVMAWTMILRIPDNAAPAINELWAVGNKGRLRTIYLRLHRYNFLLVFPFAVGVVLLNKPLIRAWVGGNQYGGELMTWSLALFGTLVCVSQISRAFISASGEIRTLSRLSLLEGLSKLTLSIGLGWMFAKWSPQLALGGVMLATVIADLPTAFYVQIRSQRDLVVGVRDFVRQSMVPAAAPALVSCLLLLLVMRFYEPNHLLAVVLLGGGFVVVHCLAILLFSLENDERDLVRRVFFRFVGKFDVNS